MIPDFTADGLLPPGIHQADIEELKERFAIFDQSDQRLRVFDRLERLIEDARSSAIVERIIVGGSFITAKSKPNDFDCVVVLSPQIVGRELRPFEYNMVSRKAAHKVYGGDVLPALEGSEALREYIEFFQSTRDDQKTGVVELVL